MLDLFSVFSNSKAQIPLGLIPNPTIIIHIFAIDAPLG